MITFTLNAFIIFSILNTRFNLIRSQQNDLVSPCPEIFSYHSNERVYGKIRIPLNNWPTESLLNVTLSVAEQIFTDYPGTLEPLKDNPVNYNVHFTPTVTVPRVTQIYFNGNLICNGSPAIGGFVTTIKLYSLYKQVRITRPQLIYNNINPFFTKEKNNTYRPIQNVNVNHGQDSFSNYYNNNNNNHLNVFNHRIEPDSNFSSSSQLPVPTYSSEINHTPKVSTTPKYEPEIVTKRPNLQSTKKPDYDIESICGTNEIIKPLISYGSDIIKGEYPWITAIFKETTDGIKFLCGGSLFTHKHIVTAAHCFQLNNKKTKKESLSVFLGRHNIRKWSNDPDAIVRDVEDIFIHPQYSDINTNQNNPGLRHDIAVIQLNQRVTFVNIIRPVCLWTKNPNINLVLRRKGTVVGWGRDENGVEIVPTPKQIQMPIASEVECVQQNPKIAKFISNTTFCAGNLDDSGPCTGDSGSGFVLSENDRWTLRGIVSASLPDKEKKCDLSSYVIFTDVGRYYEWLYAFVTYDANND